jgi:hypothetical protein
MYDTLLSNRDNQVITSNEETDMIQNIIEATCENTEREAESDSGFLKIKRFNFEKPFDTLRQRSMRILNKSC